MSKFFKALENADRERAARGERPATVEPAPERHADAPAPPMARTATVEEAPRERVTAAATTVEEPPRALAPSATITMPPSAPAPVEARISSSPYGAPVLLEPPIVSRGVDRARDAMHFHASGELDDHLVSVLQPTSVAAEQYRAIRLYLETLRRERDLGLVAITSARRGDGKTLSAINLAGTLAQATNTRVVLVEAELRRPAVARYLGMSNAKGLSTYLLGDVPDVESLLERPVGVGFTVLLAGPPVAMPYELLKSPRLRDLFAELRRRFDHVILDTPPVLPVPDVGILRDLVDGFLVVVRAQRTPRETVQEALGALGPEQALGVIFNDDERLTTMAAYGNPDGAH